MVGLMTVNTAFLHRNRLDISTTNVQAEEERLSYKEAVRATPPDPGPDQMNRWGHSEHKWEQDIGEDKLPSYMPIARQISTGGTSIRDGSAHRITADTVTKDERFAPNLDAAFLPEVPGQPGGLWDFSGKEATQATPQGKDPIMVPVG